MSAAKQPKEPKIKCAMPCCTTPPEAVERIRADVARYTPGLWSSECTTWGVAPRL